MPSRYFESSPSPEHMSSTTAPAPKAQHLRLPDGVYVPTVAFFTENDDIDAAALEQHIIRLINSGVSGIVVHGSNGEAAHLMHDERAAMVRIARDTIRHEAHEKPIPLIAGCGAQSTKETLQLCEEASKAGATHALILPPSYYNSLLSDAAIIQYYGSVADRSPIPIIIYNFPAAASGRDLTSDTILTLSRHPNIVGVKLTCGNTGKLTRVAADCPEGFFVGGGSADFILQGRVVGASGTISGLANLCPKACVRIGELADKGQLREARELQAAVAKADWVAIRTGFVGVKVAIAEFLCFGNGMPRAPCEGPGEKARKEIVDGFIPIMGVEALL